MPQETQGLVRFCITPKTGLCLLLAPAKLVNHQKRRPSECKRALTLRGHIVYPSYVHPRRLSSTGRQDLEGVTLTPASLREESSVKAKIGHRETPKQAGLEDVRNHCRGLDDETNQPVQQAPPSLWVEHHVPQRIVPSPVHPTPRHNPTRRALHDPPLLSAGTKPSLQRLDLRPDGRVFCHRLLPTTVCFLGEAEDLPSKLAVPPTGAQRLALHLGQLVEDLAERAGLGRYGLRGAVAGLDPGQEVLLDG